MSVDVASGTFTIAAATTAGNTAATVSGLSFQPKAVLLGWSGRATTGQGEASSNFGIGIFTGTSSRRAFDRQSGHGNGTISPNDSIWRNDSCVATMTVAGAVGGLADVSAINSDGFTLVVDDQFPADLVVGWVAWGGSDITDVAIVDWDSPGSPGDTDITSVGFSLDTGADDKCIIVLAKDDSAANTADANGCISFGVGAGNSIAQALFACQGEDEVESSDSCRYGLAGQISAVVTANQVTVRESLAAWLSNGFRITTAEAGVVATHSALVIKGGRWFVGDNLTSTGTSNQTESTPYVPKALVIGSHGTAASTSDTTQTVAEAIIGAATGASARWSCGVLERDNVTTSDIGIAFRDDAMYVKQSTGATVAVQALMDLVSFDATPGFTFVMDDAASSAEFFFYLGAADEPGGGGGGGFLNRNLWWDNL